MRTQKRLLFILTLFIILAMYLSTGFTQDYTTWNLPEGAKVRLGKGKINEIAYSPDGALLAVASSIGIWLYDVDTFEEVALLTGHTRSVSSVSFSPDGQTLATGSSDDTVRLWDVATGTLKNMFEHKRSVESISFSPDGQTLATGGYYRTAGLWDVATGTLKNTLEHTDRVPSVSFSPDGQTLATGSADGTVRLWDVDTGTLKNTLEHTHGVNSVSFSPDGQTLATGTWQAARLWDIATGTLKNTLEHRQGYNVNSVSFSPDGQTLATASEDDTARLWDVATGTLKNTLTGHTSSVYSVAFSPDGQTLATASADGTVLLWDIAPAIPEETAADVNAVPDLVAYYPFDRNSEDASGNGNHGQIIGTTTYVEGKFGDAIALNGGDYVEMEASDSLHGDLFKADPFTLAAWIYPQTGVGYQHVWRSLPIEAGHNTLFIFEDTGIISWRGFVGGVWSWGDLCETGPGVFETETWVHVAVTNDGDKFRIYADGEKVAETDFQETDGGNTTYRIGDLSNPLIIDDYAVFSKALSEDQINLIMNTGVAQFLQTTQSADIEDAGFPEDVNGDGIVNIQDLVIVAAAFGKTGENDADVNADGTVNIQDLVIVAAAFGEVAAAPSVIRQQAVVHLTQEDVQYWLTQTQQLDRKNLTTQRGILFLQYLLSVLTPQEMALLQNYPNPFNPETWIPYQLSEPAAVRLTIYDIQGRVVRDLDLGHQRAGMYHSRSRAAYWDGRNAVGEPVASGAYFYTLTAGDFTTTRKMLIRK